MKGHRVGLSVIRAVRIAKARRSVGRALKTGDDQRIIAAYDCLVDLEGGNPVTPQRVALARIRELRHNRCGRQL